eukprot:s5734_g2.t1
MKRPAAKRPAAKLPMAQKPSATAVKRPAAVRTSPSRSKKDSSASAGVAKSSEAFRSLLKEHILESMYKQIHLASVVEGRDWSLSLDRSSSQYGKLCFGEDGPPSLSTAAVFEDNPNPEEDLAYHCQILGSESDESNTWLWAWANEHVPEDMTQAARGLSQRQLPLEAVDAGQLAMVASGLCSAKAYYSGLINNGLGRMYAIITDETFPARQQELQGDAARLMRTIGQTAELGWVPIDRTTLDAFLRSKHGAVQENGSYALPGGASALGPTLGTELLATQGFRVASTSYFVAIALYALSMDGVMRSHTEPDSTPAEEQPNAPQLRLGSVVRENSSHSSSWTP